MSIKPEDRFATAAEYIAAHAWAKKIDDETREALESIVVKRSNVWTLYREPPKDPVKRAAWEAWKTAKHVIRWGSLPSGGYSARVAFFLEHPDQQQRFERLFDKFVALAPLITRS